MHSIARQKSEIFQMHVAVTRPPAEHESLKKVPNIHKRFGTELAQEPNAQFAAAVVFFGRMFFGKLAKILHLDLLAAGTIEPADEIRGRAVSQANEPERRDVDAELSSHPHRHMLVFRYLGETFLLWFQNELHMARSNEQPAAVGNIPE
jgi:hypothetical protein